jgi:hydroxyethylthiazole kinase-like uncharacterized protein yjeF
MTFDRSATVKVTHERAWPLHATASSRRIEQRAQSALASHALMQRAGLAVAQLALAIAPHGQRIWIACGPGNNGGDGLEAAAHLHRWGKTVHVTWLGDLDTCPHDTRAAHQRLMNAGVTIASEPPTHWDLSIDALLGLGCTRAPEGTLADWLTAMLGSPAPCLHVDVPSGLSADTGLWLPPRMATRQERHTLSLLTLKPGLFTADGRDVSGQVWFNDLGVTPGAGPDAWLQSETPAQAPRRHNSHKGTFGDVVVIGGDSGMRGAALLAGHAALRSGAGRVMVSLMVALLDDSSKDSAIALASTAAALAAQHPTLMLRDAHTIDLRDLTVVCGCGGGDAVRAVLPRVLSTARQLVLDADGLNALHDASLRTLLLQRRARGWPTVLTPHPLEAARLLQTTAATVQHDRLAAARALANQTQAVVVLKGSGTVIARPDERDIGGVVHDDRPVDSQAVPVINPTGNARLASAGTGDVLAGCIGALMAQGLSAFDAACAAVARHGRVADAWPAGQAFDALAMTERL